MSAEANDPGIRHFHRCRLREIPCITIGARIPRFGPWSGPISTKVARTLSGRRTFFLAAIGERLCRYAGERIPLPNATATRQFSPRGLLQSPRCAQRTSAVCSGNYVINRTVLVLFHNLAWFQERYAPYTTRTGLFRPQICLQSAQGKEQSLSLKTRRLR